jgi:DNA-binding CsgD family transcriptional regulator
MIHDRHLLAGRANGDKSLGPGAQAADAPESARFEVDGHCFVAVPRSPRDRRKGNKPAEIEANGMVVGRLTCSGRRYLVYDAAAAPAAGRADRPSVADILTARELQVALLIGDGKCDKEIARHLGISGYTVREHIRRIFAKLHIGRRSAIVACVLR